MRLQRPVLFAEVVQLERLAKRDVNRNGPKDIEEAVSSARRTALKAAAKAEDGMNADVWETLWRRWAKEGPPKGDTRRPPPQELPPDIDDLLGP